MHVCAHTHAHTHTLTVCMACLNYDRREDKSLTNVLHIMNKIVTHTVTTCQQQNRCINNGMVEQTLYILQHSLKKTLNNHED